MAEAAGIRNCMTSLANVRWDFGLRAGGTSTSFKIITTTDTRMINGSASQVTTHHQSITCMRDYADKSFEELRFEDYTLGRRHGVPNPKVGCELCLQLRPSRRKYCKIKRSSSSASGSKTPIAMLSTDEDNKANFNELLSNHLTCPVCLELPENEIYQCQNGHSVCKQCSMKTPTCSICRVPYGSQKVRNRAMEALLDNTEVECKYRDGGCDVVGMRKDLIMHFQQCKFRPIDFCKRLGFHPNCGFASSAGLAIMEHLIKDHGALQIEEGEEACIENFGNFLKATGKSTCPYPKFWILCTLPFVPIVICVFAQKDLKGVSFVGFHLDLLNFGKCVPLKFTILENSNKTELISWTNQTVEFTRASEKFKGTSFRIDIKYLNSALQGETGDYDLVWKVARNELFNTFKLENSVNDLVKKCRSLRFDVNQNADN